MTPGPIIPHPLAILHEYRFRVHAFPTDRYNHSLRPRSIGRSNLYCVYIVTNRPRDVLYTGMTNDLERRIAEHRLKINKGFTSRYNLSRLVYFECTEEAYEAITWEKEIKRWVRRKKVALIERDNPEWRDLSEDWYAAGQTGD